MLNFFFQKKKENQECVFMGKKELLQQRIVGFQTSLSAEVRLRKLTLLVDGEDHNTAGREKMR
ncbi:hypothetical protein ADH74_13150 [Bacteroides caecimuris]|uniref:Uncharacterized protein n=2 Tax=Bacteroides TaxID=816 RepID=A0A1C7H404_9BACE|nr:hypothetical protein A4V03_18535 [Bacteroides caecimuris]OXE63064.1 hypothetical protein ADH74_13150 [Bacteroides caecimuris]RLT80807.1 hypothetical protein D7Y07_06130 [Bacteroides acidifaciens]